MSIDFILLAMIVLPIPFLPSIVYTYKAFRKLFKPNPDANQILVDLVVGLLVGVAQITIYVYFEKMSRCQLLGCIGPVVKNFLIVFAFGFACIGLYAILKKIAFRL